MIRVAHMNSYGGHPVGTIESFNAITDVDVVEYDAYYKGKEWLIAHDRKAAKEGMVIDLETFLQWAVTTDYRFHCDIKTLRADVGVFQHLGNRIKNYDLHDRTLVCSHALHPLTDTGIQTRGWSLPLARAGDYSPLDRLMLNKWEYWRNKDIAYQFKHEHIGAVMLKYTLINQQTIQTVHHAGGLLHAWTVDDATVMDEMIALGVDGITTNDPELLNSRLLQHAGGQ